MDRNGENGRRDAGGGRPQPSSIDVARLAGVSQSAVSRAFTAGASVSSKTREKVIAAARKLGYQPSILPRILVTHRSQLIAIIIGGMYNPYYAQIFEHFTRRFQEEGLQVLVFFVEHNEYFDAAIPLIMRYRVDGIISALSILSKDAADECERMRVPVVLFNGRRQNSWVSSVCCDNIEGGRQAAKLLFDRGCARFAYIAGRATLANTDRQTGYVGRLKELGVEDIVVAQGDFHYEGGYAAARELLSKPMRPDAIFCANDLTAIGAIECARQEFGLDSPRDLKIVGFDDATFSAWPSYGLTTVRQNGPEMVDCALELLQKRWREGPKAEGRLRLVSGTLVERKTTANM
jgi:DNA-binding LacI/PurR family transcriptional regulator